MKVLAYIKKIQMWKQCLFGLVASFALTACDGIYDDEGDCSTQYSVQFVYDRNMNFADGFAHAVKRVTLYAFDESGRLVYEKTEAGSALSQAGYRMNLNDIEPGTYDFLAERVPYYDGGSDSVYEHLKRAVAFTHDHLGKEGFPLMLRSDWNDALFRVCREGKGESIWTSMQFGLMLKKMEQMAKAMGEGELAQEYENWYQSQRELVNIKAWDGAWFRRAIMDSGEYVGKKDSQEAKIWLNTQSWSVISGLGDRDKQIRAMDSVKKYLDTELGIRKI